MKTFTVKFNYLCTLIETIENSHKFDQILVLQLASKLQTFFLH